DRLHVVREAFPPVDAHAEGAAEGDLLRDQFVGQGEVPDVPHRLVVAPDQCLVLPRGHPTAPDQASRYAPASIDMTTRESNPEPLLRHSRRTPPTTTPSDPYSDRARALCSLTSSHSRSAFRSTNASRFTGRTAALPRPWPLAVTTSRLNSMLSCGLVRPASRT